MASYGCIVALFVIAGIVSAHASNPAKTVRLGDAGVLVQESKARDGWDPEVLKSMVYEYKSDGLDPQIVNGNPVLLRGKYPSVVALVRVNPSDGTFSQFCTGTMIDNHLVLTAASCVQNLDTFNYDWAACGGVVDLTDSERRECISFDTWWWPIAYDDDQFYLGNDLSVIRLRGPLTVDPIKRIKVNLSRPESGTEAVALGFGDTFDGQSNPDGKLRRHSVRVVLNNGECTYLSDQGLGGNRRLICADGFYDGVPSVACAGDGGGPLIVPGATAEDQYMVGVNSFGASGCDPNEVSVYSSLFALAHIAFLREAVLEAGGTILEFVPTPTPTPKPPTRTPTPTPKLPTRTPTPTPKPKTPTPTPKPSSQPDGCPACQPCPATPRPQAPVRLSETRLAACAALGDMGCLHQPHPINSTCCAEATAVLECWTAVLRETAPDHVASFEALVSPLRKLCI